jgi:hypothetical protein
MKLISSDKMEVGNYYFVYFTSNSEHYISIGYCGSPKCYKEDWVLSLNCIDKDDISWNVVCLQNQSVLPTDMIFELTDLELMTHVIMETI